MGSNGIETMIYNTIYIVQSQRKWTATDETKIAKHSITYKIFLLAENFKLLVILMPISDHEQNKTFLDGVNRISVKSQLYSVVLTTFRD